MVPLFFDAGWAEANPEAVAGFFDRVASRPALRGHFAASREWEDREFRRAITDWELARYFEII